MSSMIKLPRFSEAFNTAFSNQKAFDDYCRIQAERRFLATLQSNEELKHADNAETSSTEGPNQAIILKHLLTSTDMKKKTDDIEQIPCVGTSEGVDLATKTNLQYQCNFCGNRYKFPSQLKSHVISHSKLKQFKCLKCPKSYTQHATLKRHYRAKHSI